MALPISAGNGSPTSQANTQTPQASVGPASKAAAGGSSVQPGTATNLLTSTQGIKLDGRTQLSVVNINTAPQTITGQTVSQPPNKSHHNNPLLLGIAGAFLVLAVVFFVVINRSAKNNKY